MSNGFTPMHIIASIIVIILCANSGGKCTPIHGRYTRDVDNYELLVPRKLTDNGNFLSYSIPHYYKHMDEIAREKRESTYKDVVHYGINLGGKERHIELHPNHGLISPNAFAEHRDSSVKVKDRELRQLPVKRQCQFTGTVRGVENSRAALTTCDGLAGYVSLDGNKYFVEPLHEHIPNKRGQHLHMVYQKPETSDKSYKGPSCGTTGSWEDAWKESFRDNLYGDKASSQNKRGLNSSHRYLETLVVADKKFLDHYKGTDYELYILTIMNMVSDFYHDASVGNQMDVVVVRLIYLEKEEEEIDLAISQDADKTLASFCGWQLTVNPKDIKNPNHHDIAILLTRYDICADNMTSCGLMGLAYVATACSSDKPCAINEDSGLVLGIVTAHEVGHVMGCSHDKEDESGCKPQAEDDSYYVMSPHVHIHTNVWSTCSRAFITTFFDNDLGECLNDEPEISLFQDNNMLPGTVYDAKYQCQLEFPGSSVCKVDPEKFCERMLCRTSPTKCMTNGEPYADGTHCGENKWCYNKKCIQVGERPEAVNGGWGEWGEFSHCSRTCGGGVSMSERDCNNPKPQHKGRYCLGSRKKLKICNSQPCPAGVPSFRAFQCSEFDSKPFQEKLYTWKPFIIDDDPCVLNCINNDNIYVKMAPRAKDGTRCKPGSKNMCVSGVCRVVGCDNVLDSDAIEDECGVCKGDGTECKIVKRTFQTPPPPTLGYVKVAVIFRGCRNIVFEELAPSVNTIAVSGPDEKTYYLNGAFSEQMDGSHAMGGVDGFYSHPEPDKESLVIHGPLAENIVLFVAFYDKKNVGYTYKYAEPAPKSNYQPSYHWEFVDWGECSVRCGSGIMMSEPKCIEEKNGLVASSFCQAIEKPEPKTKKCNEQPCRTKWRIGKWGKCMACKNLSGMRMREVECVRQAAKRGEDDVLVEKSLCTEKKPGTKQLCESVSKCSDKKRTLYELPNEMMRKVWLQTAAHAPSAQLNEIDSNLDIRNKNQVSRNIRKSLKRSNYSDSGTLDDICGTLDKLNSNNNGSTKAVANNDNGTDIINSSNGDATKISVGGNNETKSGDVSLLPSGKKPNLKVGAVITDLVNPDDIVLVEVPIKQSHKSMNLSDDSYENMGDKIPDTIDTSKELVHKGAEAKKLINQMQHNNDTKVIETN